MGRVFTTKQLVIIDCLAAVALIAVGLLFFMPVNVTVKYCDLDGQKTYMTATIAADVGDFVGSRYPELDEKDIVEPAEGEMIRKGMEITIKQGREMEAEIDGKQEELYVLPVTVKENLKINGVDYDSNDIVIPAENKKVTADTKLVVKDVVIKKKQRKKDVAAKYEAWLDPSVSSGTVLTTEKKDGRGIFDIKTKYINGKKSKTSEELVKWIDRPVNGKKVFGTSLTGQKEKVTYSKVFTSETTAYTERKGSHGAAGGVCVYGTCAVDPARIPYGTKLFVEGYGFAVANDCGGAIDGNDLDLYMNSESACNSWGRRWVKVYVLSNSDRVTVKLDKED